MTTPTYKSYGYDIEYDPKDYISTLDWFNIASCARKRMTEHCQDMNRWRGERRTFYSSLQAMDVDTKWLLG